jgi:PPOX class probable F420-dependent enzyme
MASIQDYADLLQKKKTFAHLATTMPDGAPQSTPVWIDYRDGRVLVNTAKGRVKTRNMHLGSPVALSITDPDNPYRYVQVRGVVSRIHDEGADAHIDFLAKKYLGQDKYPFRQPGEERVIYEIEPQRVQGAS